MVDKNRTQQVLINLLHNAIKFSKPSDKITVKATQVALTDADDKEVLHYFIKVKD